MFRIFIDVQIFRDFYDFQNFRSSRYTECMTLADIQMFIEMFRITGFYDFQNFNSDVWMLTDTQISRIL